MSLAQVGMLHQDGMCSTVSRSCALNCVAALEDLKRELKKMTIQSEYLLRI